MPSEKGAERAFQAEGPVTFASKLLDTQDFPARWYCGTWSTDVGWLHILSDISIFGAYFAIPCVLLFFLHRRPDVPFPRVIWLFAAFILLCGFEHLLEACIFWWPAYRLAGALKFVTAVISWITVGAIVYLTPKALNLPGAATLAKEVAERDQMLRNIIAVTPYALFWKDREGKIAGGNAVFAELLGLKSTDEISGIVDEDLGFDPEDVRRYRADDNDVLQNGTELLDYEELVHTADSTLVLRTSKVPLRNGQGEIVGLVGISVDVTEMKQAEKKLRHAEHMFNALLSANIVGIATCGLDGTFIEANDEVLRILQASSEQLESRRLNWKDRTPDEFKLIDQEVIQDLELRGVCQPYEKRYIRSDGTEIPVLLGMTMLDGDEGRCLCFILDVSKQKQTEDDLQRAIGVAEESSRAKSEFLANMSHEMRTPLNGILGFADVLRRGITSPDQLSDHLKTIHKSGTHLLRLINDILDLSKIEAGKMELEISECAPHQVLNEVISILRVTALEKGLQLCCLANGEIPKTVQTDESRLRQVLMNLVANAVKFTDEGGVKILVRKVMLAEKDALSFKITDTGIGMAKEKMERIFNAFDQGDSSVTRRFGGTGLGLTISRHIANGLGGVINVESIVGLGSSFEVVIPTGSLRGVEMIEGENLEALMDGDLDSPIMPAVDLSGVRVLLCEDGDTNRELVQLVLEDAGASVIAADNGAAGLELIYGGEAFDVVLMDMQMPVKDGYTAASELRASGYTLPIVALTAHAMRGDEARCREAGCSDYLTKPIELDKLLSLVATLTKERTERPVGAKAETDEQSSVHRHQQMEVDSSKMDIQNTLLVRHPKYAAIVNRFIEKLDSQVYLMQRSLDDGAFDELAALAHWLKGAGGTVGYGCFTSPSTRLEEAVRNGEADAMRVILQDIVELWTRIKATSEANAVHSKIGATL